MGDPIAEIIADLRAMADQIAATLADYRADQTGPQPVETIDLGASVYMPEIFGEENE